MNVTLDGCCDHTQVSADDEFHEYATQAPADLAAEVYVGHSASR